MGEDPPESPQPLTGSLTVLPAWAARLVDAVVAGKDAELVSRLRTANAISPADHQAVADIMSTEFSTQVHGPDWVPTAYGKQVDDALGQFFLAFPADRS